MPSKLLIRWDPEIDRAFRRRFERALRELQVEHADIDEIDLEPNISAAHAIIAAPQTRPPAHTDDVLVLLGGPDTRAPGEARNTNGALRLETTDIDNRTRRWTQAAERIGAKLDRPGLAKFAEADSDPEALKSAALAFPADPLARDAAISLQPQVLHQTLAAEKRRADDAEQKLLAAHRDQDTALRAQKAAQHELYASQQQAKDLAGRNEQLAAAIESTAYALASVPEKDRAAVAAARDHAWLARLAATRALDAAERHPDALGWKTGVIYSGETQNGQPHGHGIMSFSDDAHYRGEFEHGLRVGHGHAVSDGCTWLGQFANNEACGLGLLETSNLRFEGEVTPDTTGAPRRVRGRTWRAGGAPVHQPVQPLLPKR